MCRVCALSEPSPSPLTIATSIRWQVTSSTLLLACRIGRWMRDRLREEGEGEVGNEVWKLRGCQSAPGARPRNFNLTSLHRPTSNHFLPLRTAIPIENLLGCSQRRGLCSSSPSFCQLASCSGLATLIHSSFANQKDAQWPLQLLESLHLRTEPPTDSHRKLVV